MRALARGESGYSRRVGYRELRRLMDEADDAADYLVVSLRFDRSRL